MDFIKNSEQAALFLDQEPASEPIYWRTPDLDGAVRTTDRRRKAWKNYEGEMTCKYTRHKATSGAATAASAATEREKERRTLEGTSTTAKRGTQQNRTEMGNRPGGYINVERTKNERLSCSFHT